MMFRNEAAFLLGGMLLLLQSGCTQQMADQPRYEEFEASAFFEDGMSARQPVPGTVARGQLIENVALETGKVDGKLVETMPLKVTRNLLERGRQRYGIFCTPCHGEAGYGDGMVVARGFPQPPSFHIDRLRNAPPGHLFDVITNGIGRMPNFAARIEPGDRWAVIAYLRALQLSQHAALKNLPDDDLEQLKDVDE